MEDIGRREKVDSWILVDQSPKFISVRRQGKGARDQWHEAVDVQAAAPPDGELATI